MQCLNWGKTDSIQTVSAIATCVLGLILHPDVLKKAQQEIDTVLGHGQLPTFENENSLPYLTAITKEAFRWREVTPIGLYLCIGFSRDNLSLIKSH